MRARARNMLEKKLINELQEYIEEHLKLSCARDTRVYASVLCESMRRYEDIPGDELETFIKRTRKPTFHQLLFGFIDQKGAADSDIYKKAGIDRRHFSKIRSNPNYRPGKNTAIALAVALELSKEETGLLLGAAGFSLSESDLFDLVIQFFLEKKIYDLHTINLALDYFSLKPLAGAVE